MRTAFPFTLLYHYEKVKTLTSDRRLLIVIKHKLFMHSWFSQDVATVQSVIDKFDKFGTVETMPGERTI